MPCWCLLTAAAAEDSLQANDAHAVWLYELSADRLSSGQAYKGNLGWHRTHDTWQYQFSHNDKNTMRRHPESGLGTALRNVRNVSANCLQRLRIHNEAFSYILQQQSWCLVLGITVRDPTQPQNDLRNLPYKRIAVLCRPLQRAEL